MQQIHRRKGVNYSQQQGNVPDNTAVILFFDDFYRQHVIHETT